MESCIIAFNTYSSKRIPTKNTHGTGYTFSAALTAEIAKGASLYEAVTTAKGFIQAAIEEDLKIGSGHGQRTQMPLFHKIS